MPSFCVTFAEPATYQSGHPKAERQVTHLWVSAPTTQAALAHALRTTTGCPDITSVVEGRPPQPAPIVEIPEQPPLELDPRSLF